MSVRDALHNSIDQSLRLLPKLAELGEPLERLGAALMECWGRRGKLLTAGNGGSMTGAMHLAEELSVRYKRNRRALAAISLCDPSAMSCSGNDFGFDSIFERQVEALGNPGDVLIVMSTSGNSVNLIRAVDRANAQELTTVGFLGGDGGELAKRCDINLIVPSPLTARIQEGHDLLFHSLCEWIDEQVGD